LVRRFSEKDLAYAFEKVVYAIDKAEKQRAQMTTMAGDNYMLADSDFCSMYGMMMERVLPELLGAGRCPPLASWRERTRSRPVVDPAVLGVGRSTAALRTLTGNAR
jgi:glutathione S-transferase